MRLLLATRNAHKTREIRDLLKDLPLECLSLAEFPGVPEVVEDAPTIEGNARKKAVETARASGLWALADDTGLEVEALGGAPGVLSARYAGPSCQYYENNAKLLAELSGVPPQRRKAVFRTVMALSDPQGRVTLAEGRVEGRIAEAPAGENGFGYDPVFLIPEKGLTYAQMSEAEKNAFSHRFRALCVIAPRLRKLAALAAALFFLAAPLRAGRTEPGQETIWDRIMASQANRGLRQGSRYLDAKDYEAALREFQRAVAANPSDATARLMLGVALYWNGKVDESLQEYRRCLELDPRNAQAYMLVGISLAWKGEVQPSYEAFKRAAELDPSRADIQMNLGSIEETLGMVPEAMEHFRRAVALDDKNPLYHFQLGTLYRKLGRDSDAVDSMRLALKHFSGFEDALLELGAAEERRGDRKAAMQNFRKAVDLKERDSVARLRLGRLYLLGGDVKRARAVLMEAFHLTPEEGGSGLQLSVSYAGGKPKPKPEEASTPAPAAPAPSNDPLDVFRRNLERVPLEQGAVLQVDVVFVPRTKLVKASSEGAGLKRALEKQLAGSQAGPKSVRRDYQLRPAKAASRDAAIKAVLAELAVLMKEAPPGSDTRLGMNLTLTRLESAGGRAQSSGPAPKVSYQPRQVGNDLGLWVIGTGWMALVEEVLPEAGAGPHPEQADWWVATGLGYAALGDAQRALDAFERAHALEPANELGLLGRGVASVMVGSEQTAVDSYREVLRLNPKNRQAREGLKWLLRPAAVQ
jgi:XTP/dITP diphosphohydrolase